MTTQPVPIAPSASEAPAFARPDLPLVCVQGIGFVGSAMAIAVADALGDEGGPRFNVVAVDLDSLAGRERAAALNGGRLAFNSGDPKLEEAHARVLARGNLAGTTDPAAYARARVVVVDVHLDVRMERTPPEVDFGPLRAAIATLGDRVPAGCLILIETTVPPGTTEKVVAPVLAERLRARGLAPDAVLLAHSYERVMPGAAYFDSIVRMWRVYAGHTPAAADACERFLSQVVDTRAFPLTRLASTTASEVGKVLENSYRATTIAFVEEWSRFAEKVGVDLFPVIDAIRRRPTHSNFRQPGFGVGGYCLTKDPLLGGVAARQLFGLDGQAFPFSELAVSVNRHMPLETLALVRAGCGGSVAGRKILLLGVSYRPDVGDTRHAPSEIFMRAAGREGAEIMAFDPLVPVWPEFGLRLPDTLPPAAGFDAVVFTSNHPAFTGLDIPAWTGAARPLIVDGNRVLSAGQAAAARAAGLRLVSIGRGDAA